MLPTLKDYLDLQWVPAIEAHPDGGFCLTLQGLADFEMFAATRAELEQEWPTALRGHLSAYLRADKFIPVPVYRISEAPSRARYSVNNVFDLASNMSVTGSALPA